MRIKEIALALGIMLLGLDGIGQQLPLHSQYPFSRFSINPAYAGNKARVEGLISHRNHMMSLPGAPKTQQLLLSAPWQKKYMGFGLRLVNDKIGATNHFSFNLAANYSLRLGNGKLSAGLELGMDQYSVDWSALNVHDLGDDLVPTGKASISNPNGSFGLFYTTEHWYAGYSVQNLISSRLDFTDDGMDSEAKEFAHHYINFGGVRKLTDNIQLEPMALIKVVSGHGAQMDLGSYVVYKGSYGAGLMWRSSDALVFTAKFEFLEKLYVGYSYEARINSLSPYSSSSHEIMVGYFHKLLAPARKKVIHPRYYF